MRPYNKAPLALSILFFVLFSCVQNNHAFAQSFLKGFYSTSLINKGIQHKEEGDYVSAISKFTKSMQTDPNNLEADYQLGLVLEDVLHYYDETISIYYNIIELSKVLKVPNTEEDQKKMDDLVGNAKKGIDRVLGKKFESLEKPKIPIYIKVKPDRNIAEKPDIISNSIFNTSNADSNMFKLESFDENWYRIDVPSVGIGWVNGKDVLEIILREVRDVEFDITEKISDYERFIEQYPDSFYTPDAKERLEGLNFKITKKVDTIDSYSLYLKKYPNSQYASDAEDGIEKKSYELARKEDTSESYKKYLANYPNGKYIKEAERNLDEIKFVEDDKEDQEDVASEIDRLKSWIANNPDSPVLEKAEKWVDELVFAQAKYENSIGAFERYLAEYPNGGFVDEAEGLIEDLKSKQESEIDEIVESEFEFLDELSEGEDFVEGTIEEIEEKIEEKIDEKVKSDAGDLSVEEVFKEEVLNEGEFNALLESEDLGALFTHLADETDERRIILVKERIEGIYFKKAGESDSDVTAIRMYEEYLHDYPNGLYVREAKANLEVLAFDVTVSENTKDAFEVFMEKYPDSEFYQKASDKIVELAFAKAEEENSIAAYKRFLKEHPDSEFTREAENWLEELTYESTKDAGTITDYLAFINAYPNSVYVDEAQSMIESIAFKEYETSNNISDFEKFINEYPDSEYVAEAKRSIIQLKYEEYKDKDTVEGYKEFVEKYPDCKYVEDARLKIDQLEYAHYKNNGSLRAYKNFVAKFPDNRYVKEANQKIAELTPADESGGTGTNFPVVPIILGLLGIGIITAIILKLEAITQMLRAWRVKHWICKCGMVNSAAIESCSDCGEPRVHAEESTSTGPAKTLFMGLILGPVSQGRVFAGISAIAARVFAIVIAIGCLANWVFNWQLVLQLNFTGIIGGIIFQLVFVVAVYMVVHAILIRANNIAGLSEAEFTIISIVSVFLKLIGEVYAYFVIAISIGGSIFIWIAGNTAVPLIRSAAPFVPMFGGGTILGGILLLVCGILLSFVVLVLFYLLSELAIVIANIAIHTKETQQIDDKATKPRKITKTLKTTKTTKPAEAGKTKKPAKTKKVEAVQDPVS